MGMTEMTFHWCSSELLVGLVIGTALALAVMWLTDVLGRR